MKKRLATERVVFVSCPGPREKICRVLPQKLRMKITRQGNKGELTSSLKGPTFIKITAQIPALRRATSTLPMFVQCERWSVSRAATSGTLTDEEQVGAHHVDGGYSSLGDSELVETRMDYELAHLRDCSRAI